jgi:ribosomal protein S18 acetylase RimI-like enzyme
MHRIQVEELSAEHWLRVKELRLASLRDSPDAFGGNLEIESAQSEPEWRAKFENLHHIIASVDGIDGAIMTVENLRGDFEATAWVGGCWSSPEFRGVGLLRAMFKFVDEHTQEKGWQRQGLGVWEDNYSAIAVYERLGFVAMGEPKLSTRIADKFYIRMIRDAANL